MLTLYSGLTPHIYVILRSLNSSASLPRLLLLQDTVSFEDHLGKMRRLEFTFAQYFDVRSNSPNFRG